GRACPGHPAGTAVPTLSRALPRDALQQLHQVRLLLLDLVQRALLRRLVGTPAHQPGTVAEAIAGKVVVADFHHELRLERLPLGRALGRPAARPARRVAGEAGRGDQFFQARGQRRLVFAADRGREAHVVQQAGLVIEPEQERADDVLALVVTEAADHAVGAAVVLDLLHGAPLARVVGEVAPLGDDAVKRRADALEPLPGFRQLRRCRRQADAIAVVKKSPRELDEPLSPHAQAWTGE